LEFEHGTKYPATNITKNNKKMTGKIAWAHLKEFPDVYRPFLSTKKRIQD